MEDITKRRAIVVGGVALSVGLAGCIGGFGGDDEEDGEDDTESNGEIEEEWEEPDPIEGLDDLTAGFSSGAVNEFLDDEGVEIEEEVYQGRIVEETVESNMLVLTFSNPEPLDTDLELEEIGLLIPIGMAFEEEAESEGVDTIRGELEHEGEKRGHVEVSVSQVVGFNEEPERDPYLNAINISEV